jgi:hypothetical protein
MSDIELAEGIYVKQSKGSLGGGGTSRECVMETLWFPHGSINGYVELFPVMDNLQGILRIKERIPVDVFKEEYSVKDNSRDIYLELKKRIG